MKFTITIIIVYTIFSCSSKKPIEEASQEDHFISLTNHIAQSRKEEPIVISRLELENLTQSFPKGQIPRLIGENGEEIPLQTDDMNGDGDWDEISFTYSILPKYTALIKVESVSLPLSSVFQKKTNIVVFRSEKDKNSRFSQAGNRNNVSPDNTLLSGIAWENDKIAFIIDFHPEPIKLILGKRTENMILNKIDIDSKSLKKQPWGRRLFSSIDSIGPGNLAFMTDSIFNKIENYDSLNYQIVTQGPVRSVFKIIYSGIQNGTSGFNLEEEITIWSGQDGYQNNISINGIEGNLTLAAAVPIFSQDSFIRRDEDAPYHSVATFNNKENEESSALGLLLPESKVLHHSMDTTNNGLNFNYVSFIINSQEPVILYVYAGWQYQDDRFNDPEGFMTMLGKEANRMNNPIEIGREIPEGE